MLLGNIMDKAIFVIDEHTINAANTNENTLFGMDVEKLLDSLPEEPIFDLIVTSPPYNIGKALSRCDISSPLCKQSKTIFNIHRQVLRTCIQ